MAELERQLADALKALAQQKQEFDENATAFTQMIARLSHSERALGQTKAKLMDAEERERAARQACEESARDLSIQGTELTCLQEALEAARVREIQQCQSLETLRAQNEAKARELEDAHERTSRALAQEKALRDLAESLSRDSADGAAECARLNEHLKAAEHERARFIGILGALEALGREIAEVGFHARRGAEAECDRPTLKPEPAAKLMQTSLRTSAAPEITIDGVRLDP